MKQRLINRILVAGFATISLVTSCSVEDEYTNDPLKNYNALWQILDEGYSYFDLKLEKGTSWRDIYDKYRPEIKDKMSVDELYLVLNKMMRELKDGHVNLITTFDYGRYWEWNTDYPENFDEKLVKKYLGDRYRIAGGLYYTQLEYNNHAKDSIGYIRYASFTTPISQGNVTSALSRLRGCKALIIDIRSNSGGNISNSDLLASHFLERSRVVGYTRHKTGKAHNAFSELIPLEVKPVDGGLLWLRPVVLLTNRGVYSAANDFTLKMKGLPLVTVLGDQTGGGGGLPFSSELPNGWAVRYSSTQTLDAEGEQIEFGIVPDYDINLNEAMATKGYDSIIESAILYINSRYTEYKATKKWRK